MALYTSSATLSAATTDYATTNEISGTGYVAGGANLTSIDPTSSGTTAIMDFSDVSWATATFTARGALIYNSETDGASSTTEAVQVLDFGVDKSVTAGTFTVQFPAAGPTTAIIQIR
jgi:hypothetical protein